MTRAGTSESLVRPYVRSAPRGLKRLNWYAPAILWAVSSIGSGSVLFTPRVAAKYEYALLWLALITCVFMWSMIREAARYTIVTGETLLEGVQHLPGPRGWALWVIFIPQLLAAVVGVGGLSALVGSAFVAAFDGSNLVFTLGFLAFSTALVIAGGYDGVQRISLFVAAVLIVLSVAAAVKTATGVGEIAAGFTPTIPSDFDPAFVLPWIGTILAGSMGIVWFAYWTATHGYGGPTDLSKEHSEDGREDSKDAEADRLRALRSWLGLMTGAASLAVALGLIVIVSFTVLGAELLAPKNEIPSGADVASELAGLLEGVWGAFGFWAMIVLAIFALGGSVMANQDGWGRTFADITLVLLPPGVRPQWLSRRRAQQLYVLLVTGVAPAAVYLIFRDPVTIMSASGAVAAFHTPFIAALILAVNWRRLPASLRPGVVSTVLLGSSALYYLGVSLLRLTGS